MLFTINDVLRMKSRFEADNNARLTGIEVSRENYAALKDAARAVAPERFLRPTREEIKYQQVLQIHGVTVTQSDRMIPPHVMEAGLDALRFHNNLPLSEREAMTAVYRAMRDAEERGA